MSKNDKNYELGNCSAKLASSLVRVAHNGKRRAKKAKILDEIEITIMLLSFFSSVLIVGMFNENVILPCLIGVYGSVAFIHILFNYLKKVMKENHRREVSVMRIYRARYDELCQE